jgi:HD-GYP domain-containing protein (c-di-GMP phosphodiesterase class II)
MSFLATHSALSAQFAERIGLDTTTCRAIRQAFEQWDGKGYPAHLKGEDTCLPARLVQLTGPVEVFSRRRGTAAARAFVGRHRGRQFDPAVADFFCDQALDLLEGLDETAQWDAILDSEPALRRRVAGADLDDVLEAMADLVDLKSPYLAGHSPGVADLACRAARSLGFSTADVTALRRAGYLHDLGRLGISNSVWDIPASLTDGERERVRLHPYLTDRMLARVDALRHSREIASQRGAENRRRPHTGAPRRPRWPDRTRGRGARAAGSRQLQQANRQEARRRAEDRVKSCLEHLRQAGHLQPCRGNVVRDATRPDRHHLRTRLAHQSARSGSWACSSLRR